MELRMVKRKGDTGKNFENEIRRSLRSAKHITPAQAKYLYSKKYKHKSVKWDWFDKHAIPIERLKAPLRWNLQKVYEKIL